jgi:hypothetical protein
LGGWVSGLGLGVTLFVTAYLIINTTFMLYDDEGYLLAVGLEGGRSWIPWMLTFSVQFCGGALERRSGKQLEHVCRYIIRLVRR